MAWLVDTHTCFVVSVARLLQCPMNKKSSVHKMNTSSPSLFDRITLHTVATTGRVCTSPAVQSSIHLLLDKIRRIFHLILSSWGFSCPLANKCQVKHPMISQNLSFFQTCIYFDTWKQYKDISQVVQLATLGQWWKAWPFFMWNLDCWLVIYTFRGQPLYLCTCTYLVLPGM